MYNLDFFVSERKIIVYEIFVCDKMYIKMFKKKLNMEFIDFSYLILFFNGLYFILNNGQLYFKDIIYDKCGDIEKDIFIYLYIK